MNEHFYTIPYAGILYLVDNLLIFWLNICDCTIDPYYTDKINAKAL